MKTRDLSFADTAPVRIEARATVDATREQVWQVLADHRGWPSWFGPSLVSCEPTSTPEHGVGSTRRVKLRGGATVDEQFIVWDEPALWSFTGISMKPRLFRGHVERVVLDALDGGHTEVSYTMALELAPLARPFGGVLRRVVGQSLQQALVSLGKTAAKLPD